MWALDGAFFAAVGAGGVTVFDGKSNKEVSPSCIKMRCNNLVPHAAYMSCTEEGKNKMLCAANFCDSPDVYFSVLEKSKADMVGEILYNM